MLMASFIKGRKIAISARVANLSDDPEQDYFVDGVTESLTADLSRISGSFVIGRHTAFTYKGKAVDLKKVGRELNIRYVLEGSVQRRGDRLRVHAQLVDAESGNQLWGRRFDKPVANLFDLQDEIVSRLANELQAQLTEVEARRSEGSPSPNSMDLYFQGKALLYKGWTPRIPGASTRTFRTGASPRSQQCRGDGLDGGRRFDSWNDLLHRRPSHACSNGRGDSDKGVVPRAEPCLCPFGVRRRHPKFEPRG